MGEITAPILAITLVLMSVFVPVAFIPGISGELFRQFAVVITVSMVISAINALTLSPALCAVLLKHSHGPKRAPMRQIMGAIDLARDGYAGIVGRLVRIAFIGALALVVMIPATGWLFNATPTGFLPAEDQGAIFGEVRAAARRIRQSHQRGRAARRGDASTGARRRQRHVRHRLFDARRTGQVERRAARADAEAVP